MRTKSYSLIIMLLSIFGFYSTKLSGEGLVPKLKLNPFEHQVAEQLEKLQSDSVYTRAGAAEALGFLRSYSASETLVKALKDDSELVRREAVMALGWCGSREHVQALLDTLNDGDWVVRQGAWVSLTNLTGMAFPFDALALDSVQEKQIETWRTWWSSVPAKRPPQEVFELVEYEDDEKRLRGVRALGALGGDGASEAIAKVVNPYLKREYASLNNLEKHLIQSCLRSLGRLGEPQSFSVLVGFLNNEDWARHAADALADFGNSEVIPLLIEAYPKFSRPINNKQRHPRLAPADDNFVGDNMQDRMYETPYAIASTMSRLSWDNPKDRESLRKIVPGLVSNFPTDYDGAMIYDAEADQLITCHLLEITGCRQMVCDAAFRSAGHPEKWVQHKEEAFKVEGRTLEELLDELAKEIFGDVPYMAAWFPAFCKENDVPRLIQLLEHENGWIRINTAKALMFLDAKDAVSPIARLLAESHPEADYGFSGALEHAEYDDPTPRWREAFIRALGRLGAAEHTKLLIKILENERNALDIQYAAAVALDETGTPDGLEALKRAEAHHPFHSVRLAAREALWRRGWSRTSESSMVPFKAEEPDEIKNQPKQKGKFPEAIVFIKGNNKVRSNFNGQAGVDPWRQTYVVTNSGPAMRVGRNLYILHPAKPEGKVTPLTTFTEGFVADCEVSWDGKKVIFARRLNDEERNYEQVPYKKAKLKNLQETKPGCPDDPWWHIWEINVDGTGLKQITFGPYHDVAAAYLPDGRIVFSSSRIGLRDEYHGYPCVGITIMNSDGSDIHPIGFNLGGDRDPAILHDGRIIFSRLDNFYSRLKTEVTVQVIFPDGTKNLAFYGPERRSFWRDVHIKNAAWTLRESFQDNPDNRNRVLRIAQPQPLDKDRIICASSGGLVICGPGPYKEKLVGHDRNYAVTSPYPIDEKTILCAATPKMFNINGRIITCGTPEFEELEKGPELFLAATDIDLALYSMNVETGEMTMLYNDPDMADFEARPIMARQKPASLAENPLTRQNSYTAKFFCNSARISRTERIRNRGKYVRLIEGQPIVSRHETHQNRPLNDWIGLDLRWKNHGGTIARILGTIPLAADGSFYIEVPADRLLHLQVLDSDRGVVGNQIFWMYARPNEVRSCIGCHEQRDMTTLPNHFADAAQEAPIKMLPTGGEFTYLAKAWMKGWIPDEVEERTRTVHAINLIGRR